MKNENAKTTKKMILLLGIISIAFFVYAVLFCNIRSLWMDDLAQMKIALQSNLSGMIAENIKLDNNPPLSHLFSYFWIRMVPYGTGWLKLMNIMYVSIGVFFCGLSAYRFYGEIAGTACMFLCMINKGIVYLAAYTFRPYGLFFMLSAIVLYVYFRRIEEGKGTGIKTTTNIFFAILLILSVYTHYFAILICIGLFICDAGYVFRRRLKVLDLLPYPVTAVCFLPWLIVILSNSLRRLKNFWPKKPTLIELYKAIDELMGNDKLMWIFLAVLLLILIYQFYSKDYQKFKKSVFLLFIPAFSIAPVYLLSRYSSSFTSLFVSRYFIGVMPYMIILGAINIAYVIARVKQIITGKNFFRLLVVLLAGSFVIVFARSVKKTYEMQSMGNEPFYEVAEYLKSQEDYYSNDVLIYNTCDDMDLGWDYYLTDNGKKEIRDVSWFNLKKEELSGINKVYVAELHVKLSDEDKRTLTNNGFILMKQEESVPVYIYKLK